MQMVNPYRLALLGLAACLAAAVWALGWTAGFAWFGVPALEPPFADLRTISGAVSALASGFDPRLENPGDPWGRAFNYPAVWLWLFRALARLGDPVAITGLIQAALLLALGLRLADREAGPIVLLCAASPVMLLLVEGGTMTG